MPVLSNRPPARSGDSFTPSRMTKKQALTARAGIPSSTGRATTEASAPEPSAPAITPTCNAATSSPAARRVTAAAAPVARARLNTSAISSGSHTM
jgi:hypothetical protein